ncbi:MAG: hypothetical protein JEZ11_17520 [Desulfobacterales bacterium]|nr:hypothetical protein [Desulfobacterales bacterium]
MRSVSRVAPAPRHFSVPQKPVHLSPPGRCALLEKQWVPAFLDRGASPPRVWSAGCANGEEVYRFRIVWERV